MRKKYASDVIREKFEEIKPLLQSVHKRTKPTTVDLYDAVREWSTRLRVVVARSRQTHKVDRMYLFANLSGGAYTRSAWGTVWNEAMFGWIASFDQEVAAELTKKKAWEAKYKAPYDKSKKVAKFKSEFKLIEHEEYFSLLDIRPAAITTKLRNRNADAYDFVAHANPSTTHHFYDRRKEKKASATE